MEISDHTKLNFHLDPKYGGVTDINLDVKNKQIKYNVQDVTVHNIRNREHEFDLDNAGFQFLEYRSSVKDFSDDSVITTTYYKEVEEMMRTIKAIQSPSTTDCTPMVLPYMSLKRSSKLNQNGARDNTVKDFGPATTIHCDYSYSGAPEYLAKARWRPENWDELSKHRWAIFSVWRPTSPVTRDNLCVSDKRTLDDADLIDGSTSQSEPGVTGGNGLFWVDYNPKQKYYYKDSMTVNDVIVIKLFDSITDGRARCSPHSSFSSARDHNGPRKSIEVRCLVVWEEDGVS